MVEPRHETDDQAPGFIRFFRLLEATLKIAAYVHRKVTLRLFIAD
jgi:hypothetical protein